MQAQPIQSTVLCDTPASNGLQPNGTVIFEGITSQTAMSSNKCKHRHQDFRNADLYSKQTSMRPSTLHAHYHMIYHNQMITYSRGENRWFGPMYWAPLMQLILLGGCQMQL